MAPVTLEFTNLPLVEAHVRIVCERPLPFSFKAAMALARKMDEDGFTDVINEDMLRQTPGEAQLLSISLGMPLALSFGNKNGLRIRVQPNMIEVEWLRGIGPEYPRFEAICSALKQALARLSEVDLHPFVSIANMSYSNLFEFGEFPTFSMIAEYLDMQVAIPGTSEKLNKFEAAWADVVDHRLTLDIASNSPSEPPTRVLVTTAAGKKLRDQGVMDGVTEVHDFLVGWFGGLLTEKAKNEFGFKA